MNPARNRVVLLSADWPQTLYLANALQASSLEVVLVHLRGAYPKLHSYFPIETVTIESMDSDALVGSLRKICADGHTGWIIPLSDELIRRCWSGAKEFHPIIFPQLSTEQLNLINNKALMSTRARELGLQIPEFKYMPLNEIAIDFARDHGYPIVVKGATGVGGKNVRIASDEWHMLAALNELAHDQPVVQQFIDGITVLGGGLFIDGTALRLHLCEKTKLHPPRTGPSIKVRSLKNEQLKQHVEILLSDLKWTGFASIDLIWDGKRFYFLELNPRPWGAITSAQSVGVELLQPFASLLRGDAIEPDISFQNGVESCVFPGYLNYLASQGSLTVLLQAMMKGAFWRGVPKTSLPLFRYFIRRSIWIYLQSKKGAY